MILQIHITIIQSQSKVQKLEGQHHTLFDQSLKDIPLSL